MPAYAVWLNDVLGGDRAGVVPVLDPRRTVVVSDHPPAPALLDRWLGGQPRMLVLPVAPPERLPGVEYTTFRTATNPLEWGAAADEAVRCGADTVVLFLPPDQVRGQTLLRLRRLGVRRCLVPGPRGGMVLVHPLAQAARLKLRARLGWPFAARREPAPTVPACRAFLDAIGGRSARAVPGPGGRLRIAHFVNSLNTGGAERQACYAAIAQKRDGHDVRLLLRQSPVGHDGHYLGLLAPHGIEAYPAGVYWSDRFPVAWRERGIEPRELTRLPAEFRRQVIDLSGELLTRPVDVLHSYVDDCNTIGLVAACIAGTPAVVLSLRNGTPVHFPGLLRPWMEPWYRVARGLESVAFSSNSEAGARDYEQWLGMPAGSIGVIRNAFHPPPCPSAADVARLRAALGIETATPTVAGVFRLHPEKRPLFFLSVVDRLRQRVPGLRVLLAGVGVLEGEVRREIARRGLGGVVSLLGQRGDVPTLLAASDVLLLVSDWEGTPNVVLEAQHLGCVPVATDAGGTAEAMRPGVTGLLYGQEDAAGIVAGVADLLRDPARRARLAQAGREFLASHFGPAAAHGDTLALYRSLLTPRPAAQTPHLPAA